MINRAIFWSLRHAVVFCLLAALPHIASAETRPCRGFSGDSYSREMLRAMCGEPDEILEQETQRIILWRYKGYPYTIVESDRSTGERGRVDRVSGIRSRLIPKNRLTPTKSAATPEINTLFLSILDEAAAVSEK